MQAARSSLILDGETDFRSSQVKLDGIIKRPVYVADLAPVPEPPLMTVQAYNEMKASQSKPALGKTVAKMNPKSGILDGILNKVQTCLSVAGMIPIVGSVATALNTGVKVYKKNYTKAGLSLLASVPKNVAPPNPLNAHYLLTNSLLARGAAGDKKALDEWVKRVNALPKPQEKISEYEKRQRELTATYPSNPTLKWMKKNILVPGVDGINYFLLETTAGKAIERFSTSSAAAIGSPVEYEVASTGNETVDKIGDFAGNVAGNLLTPPGSGIKGQGFYSGTVKIAESTLSTKAGQAVENKLANGIGKVMNKEVSQKISNGVLTGSISGGLQSVGLSLTHDRSKSDELAEALVTGTTLGGAFGGAFAGLGPLVKSNMGKVYTSARQLTSNGKTSQMLSLLKQRMKVQASPKINLAKAISKEVKVTTKPARVKPRLSTGGTGKYKVTSPKVNPAKVISKEKMNVTTKPVKVKPRLNTSGAGKYKVTFPEINQTGSISRGKINIAAKPSSSSIKLTPPKVSKPQEMPLETKGKGKVDLNIEREIKTNIFGDNLKNIRKHAKKVTVFDDYCEIATNDGKVVRIDKHEMPDSSFGKLDELILFEDTISEYGMKSYEKIRKMQLDDVHDVAKNTGLSVEDVINLKKHLFLEKHEIPKAGGILIKKEYFSPDDEIAYAWLLAQRKEFTQAQKDWFKQLADHELTERKLMSEGVPYRRIESWSDEKRTYTDEPPNDGAHRKAPEQPEFGIFEGFDPYKYF
ncbi:hypothetical protein [Paenibacillus polymyxa]|uniref:hypothetical protein n=1 Tax=Paenibacillus polymyxa TaxID=1406 RepID=UPI0020256A67|nr:hypothetical protein [Paenibacillus polymyxa]URJ59116.1 hypothetical protein MF622_003724 [Paenibacillus polymyxa]